MLSFRILILLTPISFWFLASSGCRAAELNRSYVSSTNSFRVSVELMNSNSDRSFSLEPMIIEQNEPSEMPILNGLPNLNKFENSQTFQHINAGYLGLVSPTPTINQYLLSHSPSFYTSNPIPSCSNLLSEEASIGYGENRTMLPFNLKFDYNSFHRSFNNSPFDTAYSFYQDAPSLIEFNISPIPLHINKSPNQIIQNKLLPTNESSLHRSSIISPHPHVPKKKSSIEKKNKQIAPKKKKAKKEKKFACQYCSKRFTRKDSKKRHEKSHINPKPFTCEICGKKLSTKRCLVEHRTLHTGKPYKCDYCHKSYTTEHGLKQHQRTHSGEKPFACDRCHKRFKYKSNLQQHRNIHTNKKKYPCELCGYLFNRKENLQNHIKEVHENKRPFKCSGCLKGFKRKEHLTIHQHQCGDPRNYLI